MIQGTLECVTERTIRIKVVTAVSQATLEIEAGDVCDTDIQHGPAELGRGGNRNDLVVNAVEVRRYAPFQAPDAADSVQVEVHERGLHAGADGVA